MCGCSAHLLSMLPAKSALLEEVLDNVFLLLFSGQGETCVTAMAHSKLLLTKYRNEVLDQFKVATVSSNVKGISTILLFTQDGNTQNTCLCIYCNNTSQDTVTITQQDYCIYSYIYIIIYFRRAVILCSQTPPVVCLRWTRNSTLLQRTTRGVS